MTIPWGKVQLLMERPVFLRGYRMGRLYYFLEHNEKTKQLTDADVLWMVGAPDVNGLFQFDEDDEDGATCPGEVLEESLGISTGYLTGPLLPETEEERAAREAFFSGEAA